MEWWAILRDELPLSPQRLARMLRMTALVAIVVIVSMALRVPEAGLSAYLIFFVTKADVVTTLRSGIAIVIGLTLAIAVAFVLILLTLAEPSLRLPVMALVIFSGMYLLRTSPAGPLGLLVGFIASYSLTYADQVPLPEALVRALLWLWVVCVYPIALVVLSDLAFGTKPEQAYRGGIAERLDAVAEFLGARLETESPSRVRLERLVRLGVSDLGPYVKSGAPSTTPLRASLLRQIELLGLLAVALPDELRRSATSLRASAACRDARRTLLADGHTPLEPFWLGADEELKLTALSPEALAVALPLITCLRTVALGIRELVHPEHKDRAAAAVPSRNKTTVKSRTEAAQFALKVTLAAMTAYLLYTSLLWYSIHTAMITCFFVAGESIGATIHKLTLRLAGALVGAALGILSIIVVLPRLESVGGLALLVASVTLFATWIATGSERVSYAGWQVAIAFYLTVLQGFSRTSHMYVGRDRVIGILLGNVLMSVVFTSLWRVRIEPAGRRELSRAVDALAALLSVGGDDATKRDDLEEIVYNSLTKARQYALLSRFEPGTPSRTSLGLRSTLGSLLISIIAIAHHPVISPSPAVESALTALNESVARWLAALSTSITAQTKTPLFEPERSAVTTLKKALAAGDGTTEGLSSARLHLEWLELLRAQIEQLPTRAPA